MPTCYFVADYIVTAEPAGVVTGVPLPQGVDGDVIKSVQLDATPRPVGQVVGDQRLSIIRPLHTVRHDSSGCTQRSGLYRNHSYPEPIPPRILFFSSC